MAAAVGWLGAKQRPKNNLGTVPIFAQRKWDCPLPKSGSYFLADPNGPRKNNLTNSRRIRKFSRRRYVGETRVSRGPTCPAAAKRNDQLVFSRILLTFALLMVWVPVAACLPLPEYKGGQAAHGTLQIIVRASLNEPQVALLTDDEKDSRRRPCPRWQTSVKDAINAGSGGRKEETAIPIHVV